MQLRGTGGFTSCEIPQIAPTPLNMQQNINPHATGAIQINYITCVIIETSYLVIHRVKLVKLVDLATLAFIYIHLLIPVYINFHTFLSSFIDVYLFSSIFILSFCHFQHILIFICFYTSNF